MSVRTKVLLATTFVLLVGALVVPSGLRLLSRSTQEPQSHAALSLLATRGNEIYRVDTNEAVVLRGAVSDYFRDGANKHELEQGIEAELQKVAYLQEQGGNVMGLYLAHAAQVRERIDELDAYIAFAAAHKMYVYLMPVARDFQGKQVPHSRAVPNTFQELQGLLDFLSKRYANHTNVLYGFGAEPEGETGASWNQKQVTLAHTVRRNDPDAVLLVTGNHYFVGLDRYLNRPFPFENVIYMGGGYAADSIAYARANPEATATRIQSVPMKEFAAVHPYLAGEFGGYSVEDYTSGEDAQILEQMLKSLNAAGTSYTMYKLSGEDGFSLITPAHSRSRKGEIFFSALRSSPPTQL